MFPNPPDIIFLKNLFSGGRPYNGLYVWRVFLFLEVDVTKSDMSEIAKYRQSEEAVWNLLDAERQATKRLLEQVAAQAAVIEKLRDALAYCAGGLRPEMQHKRVVAINVLAIPTDSTQILAEVRRAERERIAKVCDEFHTESEYPGFKELSSAIRSME